MRIPRFWTAVEGSRDLLHRRVWGWSTSSMADALSVAQDRLQSVLAERRPGTKAGGYYPRVPLREPILDELLVDGEQVCAVTRNRYGAEVLNTDRVLIADVDIPGLGAPAGGGLLRRLFRRPAPDTGRQPPVVAEHLGTLANWAAANPGLGVTAYRTASGLRVFVTGVTGLTAPASSTTSARILAELGTDPIYRELCRAHGTFRARLTPKPWRIPGMKAPVGRWPYPDGRAERRFQGWLTAYEAAIGDYAVCRRLAAHGPPPSGWEQQIMRLHDDRTRVTTTLPLA